MSAQVRYTRSDAPGWLEDRDRTEGIGFRVGNLELHPGVGLEMGYDSNVFFSQDNPDSSAVLRVTPHLYLSTLGGERSEGDAQAAMRKVDLRAGLSANYFHYFETEARSNLGADADVRLRVMPGRPFSLTFTESFGRTIRPFTENGPSDNYARSQNDLGLAFQAQTRGGVLRGGAGYRMRLDYFEGDSFRYASSIEHVVEGAWTWRFLPQTALLYDAEFVFSDYLDTDAGTAPAVTELNDHRRFQTRVGIDGAFTQRFSLRALVGYAVGFYDTDDFAGDEYESVVGQLEGRLSIGESSSVSFGYDRTFARAFMGNFQSRDRLYTRVQALALGALLLGADFSVNFLNFGATSLGTDPGEERSDALLHAGIFAEYRATDWLALNGTVLYRADFTDFDFSVDRGTSSVDAAEFSKFEAWSGVRVFY
ncbi:MAG: hypothetical protein AAF355_02960 [Myxococcota bacterium]